MNWRIKKLEDERGKLIADSEMILETIEESGREATPTENVKLESNRAKLEVVATKIKKETDHAIYIQTAPSPVVDNSWPGQPEGFGSGVTFNEGRVSMKGKVGARYKDLFGASVSNDGWRSPQDFFATIHSGMSHPALNAMVEGTGSGGGFLVPTEFAAEMLDAAMEDSIVLSRATIYPMTSDLKKIAGFDSSTNAAGSLFGGIESQWLNEATDGSVTNPVVRKIELKAKKLALFTSSSNELAEDGMGLEGQLDGAMRQANGWFLDYAFLRGTGAGQPLGVLNDPALVSVDKEESQDADSIVYENLTKMLARLHPGCFNRSVWVVNPTCIPSLLSLYVNVGIGGAPIPVLRENGGGWQLLTRPLLMSEKLPSIGDAGDVILADFSQYAIGLRKEVTIEKSGHLLFMSDQTAWRAITRVDGMGKWNKAFTPANGSTQSWAVALAERA